MKNVKILNIRAVITNDGNNGDDGNYWQFDGDCRVKLPDGNTVIVDVCDTFCGAFGARYNARIWHDAIKGACAEYHRAMMRTCWAANRPTPRR